MKAARGVYGIFGTDTFLADEALEALLAKTVGEDRGDAVEVLRGGESSWAAVVDAARSRSLFASRRAVVVRNADALRGDGTEVLAYLEDPVPDIALILMGRPDRRKLPWKRIAERLTLVSADALKGRALHARVQDELRRRGLRLRDEAYQELIDRVGQDMGRLVGEIEKLAALGIGEEPLTAEAVAGVLGKGIAQPLYKLGDALMKRRPGEVVRLMDAMLEEGEPPLKVLASLHWALRRVRAARALRAGRASRQEMAERLRVQDFLVAGLLEAGRLWTEDELARAVAVLARADRRLKTSADARWVLAAAVVEACGAGQEATTGPRR